MPFTLSQFAARLVIAAEATRLGNEEGLEKAAAMLEDHAKGLIGHPNGEASARGEHDRAQGYEHAST
jgi:hypothetical protein